MLILYRGLINLIYILSPLIIIFRLIKKKEDLFRFKEKFCFFTKKRQKGKLVWFHGASVGELQSIIPLLEKLEKNKKIKQILITSNTLSSSKIINKIRFKKTIHQFFPIDTNFLIKKFLNYWQPSTAFFIDSEIWPNTILNLNEKKIPILLINGRITKKSFNRWQIFPNFSNYIFDKFSLCLPSNNETKTYLKKLGAKNIKFIGNLKFSQSEREKTNISKKLIKFISFKKAWCASSTHKNEELFCGFVHKRLKKKYKNLFTIIIPRHIERANSIRNQLEDINLKVHMHEPETEIKKDTDIYIVNSYGKTKSFYNVCKNIFLGGSLIKRGGQNPLEATRYGCNILHGPNVTNFTEIYQFLKEQKISNLVRSEKKMSQFLSQFFLKKKDYKKTQIKLKSKGQKILNSTYQNVGFFINKNDI